jgi:hypothetical protein
MGDFGCVCDFGGEDVSRRSRSRGPVSGRATAASWIDYSGWSLFGLAVNVGRGRIEWSLFDRHGACRPWIAHT